MANWKKSFVSIVFILLNFNLLRATPSSVFWTNCTTDVYATGVGHIDVDNYFTVFRNNSENSWFSPDVGFEMGVFTWKDLSAECGIDYLGGTRDPVYFNAGIALPEDKLFCHAPSFKIGFFNAGLNYQGRNPTNQNIVDFIVGKTLPKWIGGRLFLGGFSGNRAIGHNQQGFMIAYQKYFCPAKYCDGKDYFKWVFCADYASGKNTIGGGGFAFGYYFNPDIYLLTGPVWFNSSEINGSWKWSVQIDISFSIFDCKNS